MSRCVISNHSGCAVDACVASATALKNSNQAWLVRAVVVGVTIVTLNPKPQTLNPRLSNSSRQVRVVAAAYMEIKAILSIEVYTDMCRLPSSI